MNLSEKQLTSKPVFNGKILTVRLDTALLPNGNTAEREIVEHPGGVGVIPITENGEVLLVEQFRYSYGANVLEIPAGKRSVGEDPLFCGQRELKEETGASAKHFTYLGEVYPTPGYSTEIIHLYAATGLSFSEATPDEDEFLNLVKMPLSELVDKTVSGEIKDAKTQIAALKATRLIENGKITLK